MKSVKTRALTPDAFAALVDNSSEMSEASIGMTTIYLLVDGDTGNKTLVAYEGVTGAFSILEF